MDYSDNQISRPAKIWVNNALVTTLGTMSMKMALTVAIGAIIVVLGAADLKYKQCPLAMDKWLKFLVAEH